jgi:hypothetical protein
MIGLMLSQRAGKNNKRIGACSDYLDSAARVKSVQVHLCGRRKDRNERK